MGVPIKPGEFKQFLGHARGSLLETETKILLAGRLQDVSSEGTKRLLKLSAEVGRILNGPNRFNLELLGC